MDTESEPPPVARIPIPPDGTACGVIFAVLFVGTFVALAVSNLVAYSRTPLWGIIPSVLWLAIVAFCIVLVVWQVGVWASVVACLGAFSSRQFAEAARAGDQTTIAFGYDLFRWRFYYLRTTREQIVGVDMNAGQATAFAGKDMDDWSVVLWYIDPTARPMRDPQTGLRTPEVYIIGPARAKKETAELFAAVVAFLRAAGVDLQPTDRENQYRRSDP